jgi:hypothetical protein
MSFTEVISAQQDDLGSAHGKLQENRVRPPFNASGRESVCVFVAIEALRAETFMNPRRPSPRRHYFRPERWRLPLKRVVTLVYCTLQSESLSWQRASYGDG